MMAINDVRLEEKLEALQISCKGVRVGVDEPADLITGDATT